MGKKPLDEQIEDAKKEKKKPNDDGPGDRDTLDEPPHHINDEHDR